MIDNSLGTVKYRTVKRGLEQYRQSQREIFGNNEEEWELSFEYLIGSFFPELVKNYSENMKEIYTLGYADGFLEKRKEIESAPQKINTVEVGEKILKFYEQLLEARKNLRDMPEMEKEQEEVVKQIGCYTSLLTRYCQQALNLTNEMESETDEA